MVIACLPSETTYDVQCPVCGRGFLFLTDAGEGERASMRRGAAAALAAQHNRVKARSDRRRGSERRSGQPDVRAFKVERRQPETGRRDHREERRSTSEQRITAEERRTAAPAYRRGSGAAHPRDVFYLHGWDGYSECDSRAWGQAVPVQYGAEC